jgi:hypothetical protein
VGVKQRRTLFFPAQVRIGGVLFADRLSMITQMGAPSGRAARMDFSAARV